MNYDELLNAVTTFVNDVQGQTADAAKSAAEALRRVADSLETFADGVRPKAGAAPGEQDTQKLQQCLDKLNEVQGVQAQAGQRAPVGAVPWLTVAQVIATLIRTILDATKKQ